MPEELTLEYTTEDWVEATRKWTFTPSSIEGYEGLPGTVCMDVTPEPYGRSDFQRDLRKVSRKHSIPLGENIRDTIRDIRGK